MRIVSKINVGSQDGGEKKYLVQFFEDGSAICECKHYQFRSNNNLFFQCKHIKKAIEHKKNGDKIIQTPTGSSRPQPQ